MAPERASQRGVKNPSQLLDERRGTARSIWHESEDLFRSLIEQSPVSTQVFAPDGSTIMVNKAWQELWDSTPDQLQGWNILKDEQLKAQGMLPLVRRAFAGEAVKFPSIYYDPALIKRKGRPRWIDGSMHPIKDRDGRVREVVLVHQDVTDQRQAEAEVISQAQNLQESRDQLEQVLSGIAEGVTVQDTRGRLIYANQAAARLLGARSIAALQKLSPQKVLEQFELCDESNRRLRAAQLPGRRALRGETPPDLVVRYRRVGSEEDRWSVISARPVKDAEGRVVSVINIMRDITIERRAQEMVALHMTMQDGIMVTDLEGRVKFMNPQAINLLGLKRSLEGVPPDETERDPSRYLKYEVEPLFDMEKARRDMRRGVEGRGVLRIRSKPVRLIELSFSSVKDGQGKVTGGVTTLRDVTEVVTKNEQLEVIQQTMRDGVILFGATGLILYANPAATELFGFKGSPVGMRREDYLKSTVLKYEYEPGKGTDEAFQRCLKEGAVTMATGIIRPGPGSERHFDIVFAPMRDQVGKVVGVLGTYRDMTRIVEKERQTQAYLHDLETLFESSNLFSSTLNTHEIFRLVIRQVRKLMPEILECYIGLIKGDDLMLRSYYGLTRPAARLMGTNEGVEGSVIRRGQHRIIKDAAKDPIVVAVQGRTGQPGALLCLPLKVGSEVIGTITIGVDSADIFSDELLKALMILASRAATAIDHAATYEQALKERGRWEAVVHHSGEGIATIDRSGQILYWNPALERITGYTASEVLGRLLHEVFPEEELGKVMRYERESEFEVPITTRSREERWVSVTSSVVREDWTAEQTVRNIIIMIRDITRLKEIETKKSEFVSIASHELRTPLTAIKGYLSMLLGEDAGELSEQQLKFLDRIYRSTDRLVNLVEDLLSVSRIEENRLATRTRAVDLGEVLEGLWHELDYRAAEKEVEIELASASLPPVLADPGHLRQILFNLIDNAIKYTPSKGKVQVSFQRRKGNLLVHVTDTGVGIPQDQMAKLFEKFERVNNPLSVRAGGSGLGLFITKSLIERQGGNIWVRSAPRAGSTFSFSLPIYHEDLRLFKL
jgi:PAS domain S-box-containing protein